MSFELEDAIDACLARAESRLDDLTRELGGTPVPSAAQISRQWRVFTALADSLSDAFASMKVAVGEALISIGEALANPTTESEQS